MSFCRPCRQAAGMQPVYMHKEMSQMQWESIDCLPSQVQLAIRDGRGSNGAQRSSDASGAAGSKGAVGGVGAGAAGREGGDPGALLPEGAEAALLYVRFRAAAEPGLKGAPCHTPAPADVHVN